MRNGKKSKRKSFDLEPKNGEGQGGKLHGMNISFDQGEFNEVISEYIIRHIEEEAHGYDIRVSTVSECSVLSAEIRIVCKVEWFLREIQEYVDALVIGAK